MGTILRILIIKGQSQYGATRLFLDGAADAFRRADHEVEVLDVGQVANALPVISPHAQTAGRFDFVFSINICGEFRDDAGRTLSELYGGPHVLWYVDHPLSHAERLRRTPKSTALLLVDPSHVRAVRSIYGPDRFDYLGFFPHPAFGEPALDDLSVTDFVERRPIRLLWAGSFQPPDRPWTNVEGPARQIFQDAFDLATSVAWMAPDVALDRVLRSRGADIEDPALISARESATLVDWAVRTTRRFDFLKAVARTGLPLHLCGAGWDDRLPPFTNVTFAGPVETDRLSALMAKSRIVLNTNANFGEGSHERPFSASLAGAATFSDRSAYYDTALEPGKTIELFSWMDLDAAMQSLEGLVGAPERCWDLARGAKAATLAGHTWSHRIPLIIDAATAVRGRSAD